MTIHSAFIAELQKIAMAMPGDLDLSGVHMSNLDAQRQDLLQAEQKGAYIKGLLAGAAIGGAFPTAMAAIPAMANMEAAERGVKEKHLRNALELSFQKSDLGKGMNKDQIRAAASGMAKYYYDLPHTLRNSEQASLLLRTRGYYLARDPKAPAYTAPRGRPIMGGALGLDSEGRQLISRKHLEGFTQAANLTNQGQVEMQALDYIEDFLKAKGPQAGVEPAASFTPRVTVPFPDLPSTADDPAEDFALKGMRNFAQGVRELEAKYPGRLSGADASAIVEMQKGIGERLRPTYKSVDDVIETQGLQKFLLPRGPHMPFWDEANVPKLIANIEKHHGEVKVPKNLPIRLRNAMDMIKKNKGSLALASAVGGLAGMARVRAKREQARKIREGAL